MMLALRLFNTAKQMHAISKAPSEKVMKRARSVVVNKKWHKMPGMLKDGEHVYALSLAFREGCKKPAGDS